MSQEPKDMNMAMFEKRCGLSTESFQIRGVY